MPKPYDAALNLLIDQHLDDWARFLAVRLGVPVGEPTPLDTDLSSTLQADRLFRVDAVIPYAMHLEFEVSGRLGLPWRLLRYSIAARAAIDLPVHSVIVLMQPRANASDIDGVLELPGANGQPIHKFR